MKTAIYIEDGVAQLVLTPDNDFEKEAFSKFGEKPVEAKIFEGSFYDCQGGWIRQNTGSFEDKSGPDKSLIINIKENIDAKDRPK